MRSIEPNRTQAGRPGGLSPGGRGLGVAAVDPIPIFCEGLSSLVHRTPGLTWLGHAASHHAALQLCEQLKPDVIVLDSALDPNCHLSRLLSGGDPALVIITMIRDTNRTQQYLAAAIAAGVHAIVPRATDGRHLAEAIRRAHSDRRYIDPTLAALTARPKRQPVLPKPGDAPKPATARGLMPLSRREYQVLQLVAEGLENSGIAKILFLSVETVRTHVKSILRKLSARDRTHAVTIAFRSGILVANPDDAHTPAEPQAATSVAPSPR
ncbi:response regulator transcription factor [Amycolatopsis keratiniphila]|uniref:response regulator transcription factor n=1 Tax=Amycolatopsis keratiniphila TaxID=129921 RepID=UPI00087C688A|nr:response regulator transcription factor [Amycolatopsis keratiniphila]OLZ60499.1 helix-turn-helix transcriptional regulator [Amycolatopsis keratiniphila subsp. nogabecina]SDU57339.1 DNA-binding response regulator, NarL/FixJ family, contains REC and HTH domains [Amycolatopsis keratiniphila]